MNFCNTGNGYWNWSSYENDKLLIVLFYLQDTTRPTYTLTTPDKTKITISIIIIMITITITITIIINTIILITRNLFTLMTMDLIITKLVHQKIQKIGLLTLLKTLA